QSKAQSDSPSQLQPKPDPRQSPTSLLAEWPDRRSARPLGGRDQANIAEEEAQHRRLRRLVSFTFDPLAKVVDQF
ncbi:hypothetical protein AB1L30_00795, partial [Bremerella sp. JC817]|uniref:hypothetical protein n=1 Tax=Bremerella sp. JC817 TaxID=3231756 RepID=UPI0034575BF4